MCCFAIRMAVISDTAEILTIYSPFILNTAITFEYEIPSLLSFESRISSILKEYPYLVCTKGKTIIGYAYAAKQMSRAAYQWNAELSIYIREEFHSSGIASALYSAIIELLQKQNIRNLYAGITTPNKKSEIFHKKMGFSPLGCYHKTGYKFGQWHDVTWFEKSLVSSNQTPDPVKTISQIPLEEIKNILQKQNDILSNQ